MYRIASGYDNTVAARVVFGTTVRAVVLVAWHSVWQQLCNPRALHSYRTCVA